MVAVACGAGKMFDAGHLGPVREAPALVRAKVNLVRSEGNNEVTYRAVWRIAHQLVLDHCDHAGFHAAMNADKALAKGRIDAYRFWREVMGALREMGRRLPVDGERLN